MNGFEAETSGRVTDRWRVMASYAFMDSAPHQVPWRSRPRVGSQLANVPRHSMSAWSTFELPWRLEIGGGGQHIGLRTASTTVAARSRRPAWWKALPGYWVGNAMAKRALGQRAELQINVNNVTNAYYFDLIHPAHIIPGPGRTALLGLNFKF